MVQTTAQERHHQYGTLRLMKYIGAGYVIPVSRLPVKNGVVVLDDNNTVVDLTTADQLPSADIQWFDGFIVPAWINTHCHLELSHLKGQTQTGKTLIPFIKDVLNFRDVPLEDIQSAAIAADREMYDNGIQAVGDISNKTDTAEIKRQSRVMYYTFVELFDFMHPEITQSTIDNYKPVYEAHPDMNGCKKSYAPHAPYSVSPDLFEYINRVNSDGATVSMHNQETTDEDDLFLTGQSGFRDFFGQLGFSMNGFRATGTTSIRYALQNMVPKARTLLVHNTLTRPDDVAFAHDWSDSVFWATCPNANLYIENRLPDYSVFINADARMTIGTDSIMSNWQLSVWEEIKTIKKYTSFIPLETLIRWGTLNGAEALGYDACGAIEVGKTPGLVHINVPWNGDRTAVQNSHSKRIL